jgi:uncharacterized membrane protein
MTTTKTRARAKFRLNKLLQLFLKGLVVLVPAGISIFTVVWLFQKVDSLLPGIIQYFFPNYLTEHSRGLKLMPGIGFVVVIGFVILIGSISSTFIVSKILGFLDAVLERTPGVKFIYTSVKDFLEAFAGNKKKFNKPVLVNVDGPDVWRVGFITQEDAGNFELIDHAVVYIPLSFAINGIIYFVPKKNIKPLDNIPAADAMKFVISGGVSHVE